jgi:hypothetical protein
MIRGTTTPKQTQQNRPRDPNSAQFSSKNSLPSFALKLPVFLCGWSKELETTGKWLSDLAQDSKRVGDMEGGARY